MAGSSLNNEQFCLGQLMSTKQFEKYSFDGLDKKTLWSGRCASILSALWGFLWQIEARSVYKSTSTSITNKDYRGNLAKTVGGWITMAGRFLHNVGLQRQIHRLQSSLFTFYHPPPPQCFIYRSSHILLPPWISSSCLFIFFTLKGTCRLCAKG